ncbi:hypothetical protein EDD21DRAFT_368465 [Dissophora ornata]|nr:hypothetical protein EDD21DRAFT_368465 [Dissophora ornata]
MLLVFHPFSVPAFGLMCGCTCSFKQTVHTAELPFLLIASQKHPFAPGTPRPRSLAVLPFQIELTVWPSRSNPPLMLQMLTCPRAWRALTHPAEALKVWCMRCHQADSRRVMGGLYRLSGNWNV